MIDFARVCGLLSSVGDSSDFVEVFIIDVVIEEETSIMLETMGVCLATFPNFEYRIFLRDGHYRDSLF